MRVFRQFQGEVQHSPAPKGQDRRRGDAHIVGYYVLVYANQNGATQSPRAKRGEYTGAKWGVKRRRKTAPSE
jgi:hypothetical protein